MELQAFDLDMDKLGRVQKRNKNNERSMKYNL